MVVFSLLYFCVERAGISAPWIICRGVNAAVAGYAGSIGITTVPLAFGTGVESVFLSQPRCICGPTHVITFAPVIVAGLIAICVSCGAAFDMALGRGGTASAFVIFGLPSLDGGPCSIFVADLYPGYPVGPFAACCPHDQKSFVLIHARLSRFIDDYCRSIGHVALADREDLTCLALRFALLCMSANFCWAGVVRYCCCGGEPSEHLDQLLIFQGVDCFECRWKNRMKNKTFPGCW